MPEIPAITGPIDTMGGVIAVEDTFADQVEAIVAAAIAEGLDMRTPLRPLARILAGREAPIPT